MGITTEYFSIDNATNFIADISNTAIQYFVYYGYTQSWANNSSPAVANTAPLYTDINQMQIATFGKQITPTDVLPVCPLVNWVSNTVFTQYDPSNANIFNTNFYCVTAAQDVYKCISNNLGVPSTAQPTSTLINGTFQTSDGYVWKYLYTIDSSTWAKFKSNSYMPVVSNTAVQIGAIPGAIFNYQISNKGSGYTNVGKGNIRGITNTSVITLDTTSSNVTNYYQNNAIYIQNDINASQLSLITQYDGSSQQATIYPPLNLTVGFEINTSVNSFNAGDNLIQPLQTLTAVNVNQSASTKLYTGQILTSFPNQTDATVVSATPTAAGLTIVTQYANTSQLISNNSILVQPTDITAGTILTGNATCNSTSNTVTGTGTNFTSSVAIGNYLIINTSGLYGIGRVSGVTNSTSLSFSSPIIPLTNFPAGNTFSNGTITLASFGATITQANNNTFSANVLFSDSTSTEINITYPTVPYALGEVAAQSGNTFTGIVQYANSTTLILNNTTGTLTTNTYITGLNTGAVSNAVSSSNYTIVTSSATSITGLIPGGTLKSSSGGVGTIVTMYTKPDVGDSYFISPAVSITGDGSNAQAYSVVNTTSGFYEIDYLVPINSGNSYTYANVVITSSVGSGATAYPLLSPPGGHGADNINELGANYVCISKSFSNSSVESYYLPTYGSYGQVGIIKEPQFTEAYLSVNNYTTVTAQVSGGGNIGQIIYQPNTQAWGVISSINGNNVVISSTSGAFTSNTSYICLGTSANGIITNVSELTFNTGDNVYQPSTGASAYIVTASNNIIQVTNCSGTFTPNAVITATSYLTVANNIVLTTNSSGNYNINGIAVTPLAAATLTSIYKNNIADTSPFSVFNQTLRFTTDSYTGSFILNEPVICPASIGTYATVLTTNTDVDLALSNTAGTFLYGETVTQGSSNATVIFSNTTYVKCTDVVGTFTSNTSILGTSSGATATVSNTYNVLILSNVKGNWPSSSNILGTTVNISGLNSGVLGQNFISNTISLPDIMQTTGTVIYVDNITPFSVNSTSQSTVQLVIGF